jgi:hypothetical protein
MRNDRGEGSSTEEAWVQAGCLWCGTVEFGLHELRVHVAGDDEGLLEFTCPVCGRLNVRALGRAELASLTRAGAAPSEGPAPFELLEEHSGPPITWDDLIDFHEAVSRLSAGTGRFIIDEAGPDHAPAQERNAA